MRIAIIGLGLIGGSLAKTLMERVPGSVISAADPDARTRKEAAALLEQVSADAADAVRDAELAVLCVPLPALAECAKAIAPALKPGAIVTDVASVKQAAIEAIAPHIPSGVAFVPGHPVAGSEQSGWKASHAGLYAGKKVILTPSDPQHAAVARVVELWHGAGAEVTYMPADLHDRVYACISHMPQYISFIINGMKKMFHVKHETEVLRRFLRLAGSNPTLWNSIFKANETNIKSMLVYYLKVLHQIIMELGEAKPAPLSSEAAAAELFPYIAASALVAVVAREERALGFSLKPYAGSGFADFTAPLAQDPEAMLARISAHAAELLPLLKDFAAKLEASQI